MPCSDCRDEASLSLQPGRCESALLAALKTEILKTVAALPPHLQAYLSCRLGILPQATAQAFDIGQLIAALPVILQILIQLGLIPAPKLPPAAHAAPQTTDDVLLRSATAAAAAFVAAAGETGPVVSAPPVENPPVDPASGYSPRVVKRCP